MGGGRLDKNGVRAILGYLSYIIRHKWYVFVECCKLGIPWQGITHDLSKLLPREFKPYVRYFTLPRFTGLEPSEKDRAAFDLAWNYHEKANRHHWQYWVLVTDQDEPRLRPQPMPHKYRLEMLADWRGAGRALGKPDTAAWYLENIDNIILHPETRKWVEEELWSIKYIRP